MALETLQGIAEVDGFPVLSERPRKENGDVDWALFDELRKTHPVYIDHDVNMISFRIQNGPVKESGVNGCQVDTMIAVAQLIIAGLNRKFPCHENHLAMGALSQAREWLHVRKERREARNVEGTNAL